jgi:hypothetical protein
LINELSGVTVIVAAGGGSTEVETDAVTPSATAVIVEWPWCLRRTSPVPDTVAAEGSDDIHATASAATGVPVGPNGLAEICT